MENKKKVEKLVKKMDILERTRESMRFDFVENQSRFNSLQRKHDEIITKKEKNRLNHKKLLNKYNKIGDEIRKLKTEIQKLR